LTRSSNGTGSGPRSVDTPITIKKRPPLPCRISDTNIAIFVSFYHAISSFVLSRDVSEIHSSVCGCERFLKEVPAKMKT